MTPVTDRKLQPLFNGCIQYFPDALLAVSEHSRKANEKHNPGEPLHWSKHKSSDHADCVARHLADIGENWDAIDPEFGSLHAVALAWRALALAQMVLNAQALGLSVREYLKTLEAAAVPPKAKMPWAPWDGYDFGPARNAQVEVEFRDGSRQRAVAGSLRWHWVDWQRNGDIVAWRYA